MSCFPLRGIEILGELRDNNHREWFTANKAEIDRYVVQAGKEFFQDFLDVLGRMTGVSFSGKIYRMHRDLRFSKDKTPYNPYIRYTTWPSHRDPRFDACFHGSIEADRQILGVGLCEFDARKLARIRADLGSGRFDSFFEAQGSCRLGSPEDLGALRTLGPDRAAPESLRKKGISLWRDLAGAEQDLCIESWEAELRSLKPLFDYLQGPD